MTKAELVEQMAKDAEISKAAANGDGGNSKLPSRTGYIHGISYCALGCCDHGAPEMVCNFFLIQS